MGKQFSEKDNDMVEFLIQDESEMLQLGEMVGARLVTGDLLFLFGDLGAGKTTMTKGIARGLDVVEPVTSPTFQLRKTYTGRKQVLNHLDLYRLEVPGELEILEPDELVWEGVTVVEWGQLLIGRLKTDYLEIQIEITDKSDERKVIMIPHGSRYLQWVKEFEKC